jgi:hypothetical protein
MCCGGELSGEHRLLSCSFRQPAERLFELLVLRFSVIVLR